MYEANADMNYKHDKLELAMAYVMPQPQITQVYKPDDALRQGTLFPELDKPFMAKGKGGSSRG